MLTPKRQVSISTRLIVAGILWSSLGLTFHLFDHYQRTCPKDEQDGFIYPLNNHGSVVYLNLAEHRTMQAAWAYLGGSVLGLFAFGIWLSREPKVKA
jgi:hypothetical protein